MSQRVDVKTIHFFKPGTDGKYRSIDPLGLVGDVLTEEDLSRPEYRPYMEFAYTKLVDELNRKLPSSFHELRAIVRKLIIENKGSAIDPDRIRHQLEDIAETDPSADFLRNVEIIYKIILLICALLSAIHAGIQVYDDLNQHTHNSGPAIEKLDDLINEMLAHNSDEKAGV